MCRKLLSRELQLLNLQKRGNNSFTTGLRKDWIWQCNTVCHSLHIHENVLGQNTKRKWLRSNFGVVVNYIFTINKRKVAWGMRRTQQDCPRELWTDLCSNPNLSDYFFEWLCRVSLRLSYLIFYSPNDYSPSSYSPYDCWIRCGDSCKESSSIDASNYYCCCYYSY